MMSQLSLIVVKYFKASFSGHFSQYTRVDNTELRGNEGFNNTFALKYMRSGILQAAIAPNDQFYLTFKTIALGLVICYLLPKRSSTRPSKNSTCVTSFFDNAHCYTVYLAKPQKARQSTDNA